MLTYIPKGKSSAWCVLGLRDQELVGTVIITESRFLYFYLFRRNIEPKFWKSTEDIHSLHDHESCLLNHSKKRMGNTRYPGSCVILCFATPDTLPAFDHVRAQQTWNEILQWPCGIKSPCSFSGFKPSGSISLPPSLFYSVPCGVSILVVLARWYHVSDCHQASQPTLTVCLFWDRRKSQCNIDSVRLGKPISYFSLG